jgi:hypothetical protein
VANLKVASQTLDWEVVVACQHWHCIGEGPMVMVGQEEEGTFLKAADELTLHCNLI